jgi:glutamate carboxypeptidase
MNNKVRIAIHNFINDNRDEMLLFLEELVNCNSFTYNKRGVDAVGEMVIREMPDCFCHERISNESYGDHHIFTHIRSGIPPIVLAGHLDTLCHEDMGFNCLTAKGNKLVGPGVNDMKGGNATLIWALKTLESCLGIENLSIVCIFNSDEEIGSPSSSHIFKALQGKAKAALVFECGAPSDTVVTSRKGHRRYRLCITGQSMHFGNLKGPKISAVQELAAKVLAIEALNRSDNSVVLNVGRVEGGLASNVVAEKATMDFEVRFWETFEGDRVFKMIQELALTPTVPGCELSLERLSYRPPMKQTLDSMRLLKNIVTLGRELGQEIKEEKRGGVSDACWLSHVDVPTIDGLGPLGDLDCTSDEYIITESLFKRVELTANLLLLIMD